MNYRMAVEACRATKTIYYSVPPRPASDTSGAISLVVIAPSGEAVNVGVHVYVRRPAQDLVRKPPVTPDAAPLQVHDLQFRPYSAGYWHQPIDTHVEAALLEWKH